MGHAGGEERLNFLPQADKIPARGSLSKDNISPWCWRVAALLASAAQPPALQPFTHVLLLFLSLPQAVFPCTHNVLLPCRVVGTALSAHLPSRQRSRAWLHTNEAGFACTITPARNLLPFLVQNASTFRFSSPLVSSDVTSRQHQTLSASRCPQTCFPVCSQPQQLYFILNGPSWISHVIQLDVLRLLLQPRSQPQLSPRPFGPSPQRT